MRVTNLYLSISSVAYSKDTYIQLAGMDYDRAKKWIEKDEVKCFTSMEETFDENSAGLTRYCDGLDYGDTTDTMLVYTKVEK